MKKTATFKGYTLIELMITLVILGVLSSWAIPEYFGYVRDSRRADAIASMTRILAQQELFFGNNQSTYTTFVASLGYATAGGSSILRSEEGYYSITMSATCGTGTSDCINLTAAPVAGTSQAKDTDCMSISINSKGRQTATTQSSAPNNVECWN